VLKRVRAVALKIKSFMMEVEAAVDDEKVNMQNDQHCTYYIERKW